jgi:hypothetical protein
VRKRLSDHVVVIRLAAAAERPLEWRTPCPGTTVALYRTEATKVNKNRIARLLVGSFAALLAAAVAVPARAQEVQHAPPALRQDGRSVEEAGPDGDAPYDVRDQNQNPDSYSYEYQGQDAYPQDPNQAPYGAPPGESWVVTDACPDGCWAPYPYGGATIVFGAPVFRGGRWIRPHAHGYGRSYSTGFSGGGHRRGH